ncbi:MAG: RNA polymerase sigma factor SigZ [Bacteroidota bacterium]
MTIANWSQIDQLLLRFIIGRVKEEALARDILQEVWLKTQLKLPQLKDQKRLLPWLYQITRTTIADHFRKHQKESLQALPELDIAEEAEETIGQHEFFSLCVPGFIDRLPEKYREALRLVEIEGLSQKELAERLQISHSGARSRVQRGRELLKKALLDCCQVSTDAYGNVLDFEPRFQKKKS